MTLQDAIETSFSLLLKKPQAGEGEIRKDLEAAGIEPEQAAKLVYFIPIALSRVVFGAVGVQFAPSYITIDEAGNETGEASFLEDPVYSAALDRCSAVLAPGEQADIYRSLAERSADYRAIMDLHLKQGLALKNLSVPPPRLPLPPGRMASPDASRQQPVSRPDESASDPAAMPAEARAYMDTVKAYLDRPFVKQYFYEVTLLEWNVPEQGPVSFWALQFRDKTNGVLVWMDNAKTWRVGRWIRFAGKEIPLQVDLSYFKDCPSASSFPEALQLLEASQTPQGLQKGPWYTRLWKKPG